MLVDDLLEPEPLVPVEPAYGAAGDVAFSGTNYSSILSGFPSFAIAQGKVFQLQVFQDFLPRLAILLAPLRPHEWVNA